MKKWYFSENGTVSGPCSINDASSLLSKNNNLYGWNPSFSQWLPVNQIPELSKLIPESKPAAQVPKALIDKFITQKRNLNNKIKLIDETIIKTQKQINVFEKEMEQYKNLTESLSSDMKDNILPLEKKHQLATKQLNELTKVAEIAKNEITNVAQAFNDLVLSKTSENLEEILKQRELPELKQEKQILKIKETSKSSPGSITASTAKEPTGNNEISKVVTKKKTTIEKVVALKASAELKTETSHKNTTQTPMKENISTVENKAFVGVKNKFRSVFKPIDTDGKTTLEKVVALKASVKSKMEKTSSNKTEEPIKNKVLIRENTALVGVKNKFKSVFKPKVEEPTMKLSEQLKQLEQQPKEELAFADSDINSNFDGNLLDNNDPKKKRRRRRRS